MTDLDAATVAVVAVALAPFAFWVWSDGSRPTGSSPWTRYAMTVAYAMAVLVPLAHVAGLL